jgi:hypothetical protein
MEIVEFICAKTQKIVKKLRPAIALVENISKEQKVKKRHQKAPRKKRSFVR